MDIPVTYRPINLATASNEPTGVHLLDNVVTQFYAKYFLKRTIATVKFTIPKEWSRFYFVYTMFCRGFGAILNYPGLGVIFQGGTCYGRDLYYQPKRFIVANPALKNLDLPIYGNSRDPKCVLLKLQPDFSGILDIVNIFANRIGLAYEAWNMNTQNSKLAYVGFFENKALAKSFEKLFDTIQSGKPAAAVGKGLLNENGKPLWGTFANNLKSNYIAPEISDDMRKIMNEFDSFVGIPNNPDALKKERSIVAGVESNNVETETIIDTIIESLNDGFRAANEFFAGKLSVELKAEKRYPGLGLQEREEAAESAD